VGLLGNLWRLIRGDRLPRAASTVELLQKAERARREGRLADAEALVAQVLETDPRNTLAHLLSAYLHATARRAEAARTEFRTVLSLDAEHPRAMLGLARADLEAGDVTSARTLLERALRTYPDFPEARALLDVVQGLGPTRGEPSAAPPELRLQQVALPEGTRECMLVDADGVVLLAHPASRTRAALAAHLVRLSGMAGAALRRAGLGQLQRGAVGSNSGTTFLQSDAKLILAVTLGPSPDIATAQRDVDGLWTRCLEEIDAGARSSRG
jgi:tetratricopeptide (TPR) repeat protein